MVNWKACLVILNWLILTIPLTFLSKFVRVLYTSEFNLFNYSRNTRLQYLPIKTPLETVQDRDILYDKAIEEESVYTITAPKQFPKPEKLIQSTSFKYHLPSSTQHLKTKPNQLKKFRSSDYYKDRSEYLNGQYFEEKITPTKVYQNEDLDIQPSTKNTVFAPYSDKKQFLILVYDD